jgi:hypothetical protein
MVNSCLLPVQLDCLSYFTVVVGKVRFILITTSIYSHVASEHRYSKVRI